MGVKYKMICIFSGLSSHTGSGWIIRWTAVEKKRQRKGQEGLPSQGGEEEEVFHCYKADVVRGPR